MTGKNVYALFPFNMVYSTDVGIIRFLRSVANSDDYNPIRSAAGLHCDLQALAKMTDGELLIALQSRGDPNPLSVLPLVKGNIDLFFDLLNEEYKEEIVRRSAFTDLGYTLILSQRFDGLHSYILVKDEYEEERIKSEPQLDRVKIVHGTLSSNDGMNINFDPYYINSYTDLLDPALSNKIIGKNIYISDASYNDQYRLSETNFIKNNFFTSIEVWRKERILK